MTFSEVIGIPIQIIDVSFSHKKSRLMPAFFDLRVTRGAGLIARTTRKALFETIDTTAAVQYFLLTRVEWVAL